MKLFLADQYLRYHQRHISRVLDKAEAESNAGKGSTRAERLLTKYEDNPALLAANASRMLEIFKRLASRDDLCLALATPEINRLVRAFVPMPVLQENLARKAIYFYVDLSRGIKWKPRGIKWKSGKEITVRVDNYYDQQKMRVGAAPRLILAAFRTLVEALASNPAVQARIAFLIVDDVYALSDVMRKTGSSFSLHDISYREILNPLESFAISVRELMARHQPSTIEYEFLKKPEGDVEVAFRESGHSYFNGKLQHARDLPPVKPDAPSFINGLRQAARLEMAPCPAA